MTKAVTTEALISRILQNYPKGFDLSLDRISRLLEKLGNPQRHLAPVIHIAGTNGKGSTSAFCRTILEQAGLRVHTHSSPHLVRWNERFRIANEAGSRLVSDDQLNATIERVLMANNGDAITLFEILTSAAFVLFSEIPADVIVLEVGLGGRFDATNVIDTPAVSVITPISMDHEAFLGNSVDKIAFEKAGIIKSGCPVVIGYQDSDLARVTLRKRAKELAAPVYQFGEDFFAYVHHDRMVYQDERRLLDLPRPALAGDHQVVNAASAIAAVDRLGLQVSEEAIAQGLLKTTWPARLQHLRQGKLCDLAPSGADLWLDGGHNPAGGQVLSAYMRALQHRDPRPLILIAGMINSKDRGGFFKHFGDLVEKAFAVPITSNDNAVDPSELARVMVSVGIKAMAKDSVVSAIKSIEPLATPPRILICGSLYLAGEVLAANGTLPD